MNLDWVARPKDRFNILVAFEISHQRLSIYFINSYSFLLVKCVDLLESLHGEHKDQVSPIGALKFILERHISNLDNWAITTKVFIVLHRSLQNKRVNRKVIRDLKKNEHLLHPYQKKNPDNKYNIKMFMDISRQYSVYLKYYMNTCAKTDILVKPRKGFAEEVQKLSMLEILKNYEYFEGLSTQIFDLF